MKRLLRLISAFLCVVFWGNKLLAQVTVASGTPVSVNFNSMGSAASASLPSGFRMGNGSGGFSGFGTTTSRAAGTSGTGVLTSSSAGGAYNFANGVTASSSDRSMGFLSSTTYPAPAYMFMQVQNTSGVTINTLEITFDYEKYRSGSRAFSWTFDTSRDGSTFGTSFTSGAQAYSADADNSTVYDPPTSITKTVVIKNVNIPAGGFFYVRWIYTGTGGSSNGQAIGVDNISVKPYFAIVAAAGSGVCVGSNMTLYDSTAGGSWSSSNPSIASVNSATGVVYGLSPRNGNYHLHRFRCGYCCN